MIRPALSACAVAVTILAGLSVGCASRDAGAANITSASAASITTDRITAGDSLGRSLHQSDSAWVEVNTASAPVD